MNFNHVKSVVVFLVGLVLFLTASVSALAADEKFTTLSGEVFKWGPTLPQLGDTWIDPDGVMWTAKVDEATWKKAAEFCLEHNALLPTALEFDRLRRYMGYSPDTQVETNLGYRPQIIPNLKDFEYWTATMDGVTGNSAWTFDGQGGFLKFYDRKFTKKPFLCTVHTKTTMPKGF